jgi:hypothetical protein
MPVSLPTFPKSLSSQVQESLYEESLNKDYCYFRYIRFALSVDFLWTFRGLSVDIFIKNTLKVHINIV